MVYRCLHEVQQCFTISEVTADWHELMILQRIMWPSIVRPTNNWTRNPAVLPADIPHPQPATQGLCCIG